MPVRRLRLRRGDEREAAVLARRQRRRGRRGVVCWTRADEQVVQPLVVGQVEALDRIAAAPAADQVQQPVDAAEPLAQRRAQPRAASASSRSTACMSIRSSGMPNGSTAASIRSTAMSASASVAPSAASRSTTAGPRPPPAPAIGDDAAVELAHQRDRSGRGALARRAALERRLRASAPAACRRG